MKTLNLSQEITVKSIVVFVYNNRLSENSYNSFEEFYNDVCECGDELFDYLDEQNCDVDDSDVYNEVYKLINEVYELVVTK